MKKYFGPILAILLLGVTALFFLLPLRVDVTQPSSVTIRADSAITQPLTITDGSAIQALLDTLEDARYTPIKPRDTQLIATVELADEQLSTLLLCTANNTLYLYQGSNCYRTGDVMRAWLESVTADAYTYAATPGVSAYIGGDEYALGDIVSDFEHLDIFGEYRSAAVPERPAAAAGVTTLAVPEFEFELPPAECTITVNYGGQTVYEGPPEQWAELPGEGVTEVVVRATYSAPEYRGSVTARLNIEVQLPKITFDVQGGGTPGEAAVLRVRGLPAGAEVSYSGSLSFTPRFFDDGQGGRIGLLAVNYNTAPGTYTFTLAAGDVRESFELIVSPKQFQIQNLTVDAQTTSETLLSQQANNEYEAAIAPLRQVADAQCHYSGRFIMPVQGGRITTEFGAIRYTNGSSVASRHGAVDIALPTGTPVVAPGGGRVLYAGLLQLTGNTVLIEHGYGLKTWYYHMDSLAVATGEYVKQGEKLGEVGTTGFSSGPHLHFGMSVNNVFVNPYTAVETDLFVYE